MAGVAIEHYQLRKKTVAAAVRIEQDVEELRGRERLADRPHPHRVPASLACLPVVVNHEMRRLRLREGLELEAHARMPRAHHAVGHELVAVAEVAREAKA